MSVLHKRIVFAALSGVWFFLTAAGALAAVPCKVVRLQPDAWVRSSTDRLVSAARAAFDSDDGDLAYERVLDDTAGTIRRCGLATDSVVSDRYPEFLKYIDTVSLDRLPDHALGFNVPDRQYFDETREIVAIPGYLLDPLFLRQASRTTSLGLAKSYLRQLNSKRAADDQLIFFSYTSRHLGTPDNDNSFRRLLVVVPGNARDGTPERWVQFGITDPGSKVRIRNLSVVAVVPGGDGTFNSYFKDYYRTYRPDGGVSVKGRLELGYGDDNCALCHKSGVLPIFPVAGSVAAGEKAEVERVNERFRAYGSPRFGKYLDASVLGPGLSHASEADRTGRFGKRFEGTAVAHAMSCSSCHTPDGLGNLNWPMDQVIIDSFISGGQMPRGYTLDAAKRRDLYAKLIEEYFSIDGKRPGILKSWLLGIDRD